jgi:hypothetical protein
MYSRKDNFLSVVGLERALGLEKDGIRVQDRVGMDFVLFFCVLGIYPPVHVLWLLMRR